MPKARGKTARMMLDSGETQSVATSKCKLLDKQMTFKNMRQKDMWVRLHKKTCVECRYSFKEVQEPTTKQEIQDNISKGTYIM